MTTKLEEVYSLLIPVADAKLLLPRLAIAEVTGYTNSEPAGSDAPPWLLGRTRWHDGTISLVSFEGLCGRPVPAVTHRARLAVVHSISPNLKERAFGLMLQGYPYLVRVNANFLKKAGADDDDPWDGPVLARPRMASETPMIPDIEAMADSIAALEAVA
ncbi:MAG TPA: chemotaxis protein CheW [Gammaproteobacteria bacterium]|nr:chemotaxis protein CheW [Gammaproteobacteria bacterium]